MKVVNPERFQRLAAEAQSAGFSGWDFSWLDGRMLQEDLPWDYPQIVKEHFTHITSLLDMGTGGGELLASLAPLPPDTHATESYPPNQVIARERLAHLGVQVHNIDKETPLPLSDASFDLVINRHDDFDPAEVWRVLKPSGTFISQQVGGLNNLELNQVLEDELTFPFTSWSLAFILTNLYETGFSVERTEKAALKSTFLDTAAVLYYLKAIPWQVENFSLETHYEGMVRIHNIIERQGSFTTTTHRFLVIAHKMETIK